MKLLFFAVTKHQYRYFNSLGRALSFSSKQLFFPSFKMSLKSMQLYKKLDLSTIMQTKSDELMVKYPNRLHRWLYTQLLKIQTPVLVSTLYYHMQTFNPSYLVVWNGKKFHQNIAVQVANFLHIHTIYFENGVLPHTTTMDFKGVNASNSVPREISFYQKLHFTTEQVLPSSLIARITKVKQKEHTFTIEHPYIFIPFQVSYDTQIIQHSPYFKTMYTLYETLEWLCNYTSIYFVIKEHPSDKVSDYTLLHKKQNPRILFSSQSTQELIENAEAVMSINSSVVIESLLFKKRVIVLGEAFFAIEGIVKTAHSKASILDIVKNIDTWKLDTVTIDNFLKYLYYDYLIPNDWRAPKKQHFEMIEKKIQEQLC